MTGGDIIEVTYNHPTVGDGVFRVKAGEDGSFDPGGVRNDDDAGGVAGDGTLILVKSRKRWSLEVTIGWDMNTTNEIEVLRQLCESPEEGTYTFNHINQTIWEGVGVPVGDIVGATMASNIPVKFSGGGIAQKQ